MLCNLFGRVRDRIFTVWIVPITVDAKRFRCMEVLFTPGFAVTRHFSPVQHESVTFAFAKRAMYCSSWVSLVRDTSLQCNSNTTVNVGVIIFALCWSALSLPGSCQPLESRAARSSTARCLTSFCLLYSFNDETVKSTSPTTEKWLRKLCTYSLNNNTSNEDKHDTNYINNKYTNTYTRKLHNL